VGRPVLSGEQREEIAPDLILARRRLAELSASWLSRVPQGTRPDFDERLPKEFGLVSALEEVFD
jgi:hypothetical protein